jgi:hypothetical protein
MKKVTLVFLLVAGMQTLSFSQNSSDSSNHMGQDSSSHLVTDTATHMVQTPTHDTDDHSNWGLLGLVGLIGLAGLAKKNVVERKVTYTDPENRIRQ